MFEGIEHRFGKAHKICDCGSLINEAMLIKCDKVLHTWCFSSMMSRKPSRYPTGNLLACISKYHYL